MKFNVEIDPGLSISISSCSCIFYFLFSSGYHLSSAMVNVVALLHFNSEIASSHKLVSSVSVSSVRLSDDGLLLSGSYWQ